MALDVVANVVAAAEVVRDGIARHVDARIAELRERVTLDCLHLRVELMGAIAAAVGKSRARSVGQLRRHARRAQRNTGQRSAAGG